MASILKSLYGKLLNMFKKLCCLCRVFRSGFDTIRYVTSSRRSWRVFLPCKNVSSHGSFTGLGNNHFCDVTHSIHSSSLTAMPNTQGDRISGRMTTKNSFITRLRHCLIPCLFCLLLCDCQTSKSISATSTKRRALLTHLEDPEVCAFLDMISYAEGTMSENGYRLIYSYEEFTSYNDHPRCIVCAQSKGTKLCSSAAGRYQISQKEWDRIAGIIGAKDFSPLNQDCAAVFLLLCSGALDALKAGNFSDAVNKVRKIWASMPDAPYNQPTKKEYELKQIYQKQLILHKNRLRHRNNGGDRP